MASLITPDPDTPNEGDGTRIHDRAAPLALAQVQGGRARIVSDVDGQRVIVFASRIGRGRAKPPRKLSWKTSLLDSFVEMRDGDERSVVRFVERFGLLRIDMRAPTRDALKVFARRRVVSVERVRPYAVLARRAYAILAVADLARRGLPVDPVLAFHLAQWTPPDWRDLPAVWAKEKEKENDRRTREEALRKLDGPREDTLPLDDDDARVHRAALDLLDAEDGKDEGSSPAHGAAVDIAMQRIMVGPKEAARAAARALSRWIDEAGPHVQAIAFGTDLHVDLVGTGLEATIVFQVASKAAGRAYAVCQGCQRLFEAKSRKRRAPQWGRRAYCARCIDDGVREDDADHDRRVRERTGGRPRWRRRAP